MRRQNPKRPGFTLVEILVVIAIIGILISLTAAGVFMAIDGQKQSNTENNIRTVTSILNKHMKAVTEKANKETIPNSVLTMAGGDPRRARVMWKKLRLKQEFPMTFAEALNPNQTYAGASAIPAADLPSLYKSALSGLVPGSYNTPKQPFIESSTCLMLALSVGRGGITELSTDNLGPAARDLNNDGLKEFVDGWGNPIAFFRWPTGCNELDGLNPAPANSAGTKYRDPLDPEGTMYWPGTTLPGWVNQFEPLGHLVHTSTNQAWPRDMVPTLVSPGKNRKWGIQILSNSNPDMTPDGTTDGDDNIYSFRLMKLDGRGD